jgi:FkbM family methyltransferase
MLSKLKQSMLSLVWPPKSKATILRGPLKGLRFFISRNSGWSPIVGRWEPESQQLFKEIVKPEWIVYDLGANNGIHSLLFSVLVGKAGKVFSFEPLETNCKEIAQNALANDITNISIVQAAVSDKSGETVFHLGLHDKQGSLVGIGRESGVDIHVKMITLDEFIESGNPAPDFLKIDIEGAESLALLGFSKQVAIKRPIFFIELHTPEQDEKVGAFMAKNGYLVYRQKEGHFSSELNINGLERIKDLTKPFPDPNGIWGTILAIPLDRVQEFRKNK